MLAEIERERGWQFDPEVVDALGRIAKRGQRLDASQAFGRGDISRLMPPKLSGRGDTLEWRWGWCLRTLQRAMGPPPVKRVTPALSPAKGFGLVSSGRPALSHRWH